MKTLASAILCISLSAFAAVPPGGPDRLRELVIFPDTSLTVTIGMQFQENKWILQGTTDPSSEMSRLGKKLKSDPDNIQDVLRLGYLLGQKNDTNGSGICYKRALQLCRDKTAANAEDGLALDDLGEALSGLGHQDEAESAYRKATRISPDNWRCWVNFANFLLSDSMSIFPTDARHALAPGQAPPRELLEYRPTLPALEKAEQSLADSGRCFDKAMAIAPKEPEIYFQRAGYMMLSNCENYLFSSFRNNQKMDSSKWAMLGFSAESTANLEKAAKLSPNNPDYIGLAAFFEWMRAVARANSAKITGNMLPEKTRQSIDDAIARLESLSQSPDENIAGGALEYLGFLNVAFGNSRAAATQLRRAVALDPTRPPSWDLWLGTAIKDAGSSGNLIAICKSRLAYENSAQNHLYLAKAYAYRKRWKEAASEATIAANLDPNYIVAPLMLAAIDLKRNADANRLPDANGHLGRACELLTHTDSKAEFMKRWREINLDGAIYFGLQGTPDSEKAAQASLGHVLKYYPNDQTAKQILEALPVESASSAVDGN